VRIEGMGGQVGGEGERKTKKKREGTERRKRKTILLHFQGGEEETRVGTKI